MNDSDTTCSVAGCGRSSLRRDNGKRGFCSMHYQRWKKHRDPSKVSTTPSPAKDWIAANSSYDGRECLQWPFTRGRDGYGRIHKPNNGNLTTASRAMCEAAHGPAPSERHHAAHTCGNGHLGCVNPSHLYWATPSENQSDRVAHGTSNRGARHGASRLTAADVRRIRQMSEAKSQSEIAAAFHIDQSHVSKIISKRSWAWLP